MIKPANLKVGASALVAIGLTGCGITKSCPGFIAELNSQSNSNNGKLSINISIDGSASMKGFATAKNSTFQRIVEELDPILTISPALNTPSSTTKIFRIGREAPPSGKIVKDDLDSLLQARNPILYEPPKSTRYKNVSSHIASFVSKDPNSVDVLVSDLEPDNASIQELLTNIKPKLSFEHRSPKSWFSWFSRKKIIPGNQLAVIGIRSGFDGVVFPTVQGSFPSFRYKGLRPFYVLLLGPVDKVELIIDRLSRLGLRNDQWQISRFASNPSNGKTFFADPANTTVLTKDCLFPVASISAGSRGKLNFDSDNKWIKLKASRNCNSPQYLIKFGVAPMAGFGPLTLKDPGFFKVSAGSIESVSLANKNAYLSAKNPLLNGSITFVDVSVEADKLDSLRWKSWDMQPSSPDGSKTQRLLRFLSNLRSETDAHATRAYGSRYSPIRICSAVKS